MINLYASSTEISDCQKVVDPTVNLPFHLSMCVNDLEEARHFYSKVLKMEERRSSKTSVHFNVYGCQLTCHHVPGFSAKNFQMQVDAEIVPVPHFGVALPYEEFENLKNQLINHSIKFVLPPHMRFVGTGHEQYVMFVEDPSGHGIELKSFTKAPANTWM
jgi:extradiol dioxygenase family protein